MRIHISNDDENIDWDVVDHIEARYPNRANGSPIEDYSFDLKGLDSAEVADIMNSFRAAGAFKR